MITKRTFRLLACLLLTSGIADAQQFYWSNLTGKPGSAGGGNGTGLAGEFNAPYGTAVDSAGNVYVADSANNTIRKLTLSGTSWTVTTLAGSPGVSGTSDGTGGAANFSCPTAVAVDGGGNVYVADSGNQTIREVTSAGVVTTMAGSPGQAGFADGAGGAANFCCPAGVCVDASGNVYVADAGNHVVREVTQGGVVTTFAGGPGKAGYADGAGNAALFNSPTGVAVDSSSNVYVADNLNHLIRKITSGGVVTTLAGTPALYGTWNGPGSAAMFDCPASVAVDGAGNVYVADTSNHAIRKITPGETVTILAGTLLNQTSTYLGIVGSPGYKDGMGTLALFDYPKGVCVDGAGNLYVADTFNNAIRKVNPTGDVSTIAGNPTQVATIGGIGTAATFNDPRGIAVAGGTGLYVVETIGCDVRAVTLSGSSGIPWLGSTWDAEGNRDGAGVGAQFYFPHGIAADSGGNAYLADTFNHTIRMVAYSSGSSSTIGGSVGTPGSTDGTGTAALFNNPTGVAVDAGGNLYVADQYNDTIRKMTLTGTAWVTTTILGSPGVSGTADGTGSAARFNCPAGVAVDSATNIYVADTGNDTIRKISLSGTNWVSSTLAGAPGVSGSADGSGSGALFGSPTGLAVDASGNVYVADNGNCTIREISPAGVVTTIGGTPGVAGGVAGAGGVGLFSNPYSVAVDGQGNVYVADAGNNRVAIGSCAGSGSAGLVTGSGATLYGQANLEGSTSGTAWFRYGTSALSYTTGTTAPQSIGGGTNFVLETATLSGLSAYTTYHYQLVLVTASGTFYGVDQTFVTLPTAVPNITSAVTATGTTSLPFSYQMAAGNGPTGFGASPLPAGLSVDPVYGLIAGTPTVYGTTSVTLSATNVVGAGTKTLTLAVAQMPLPFITSGTTAGGVVNSQFFYQITAANYPTGFIATGLPAGLTVNGTTGLISGVPSAFGAFSATVGAVNASSSSSIVVAVTISPAYYWGNFAGQPQMSGSADGTAGAAQFFHPGGGAVDSGGNVYVADTYNFTIRKIAPAGVVTTLAGTPGTSGTANGTGSAALFYYPMGVAVDSGSNVYVADTYNFTIRRITPAGVVTTLAGTPGTMGSANGTGSAALFYYPFGVAVDSGSNVYVADTYNSTIRMITPAGVVTTLAGTPGTTGSANGTGSAAQFDYPMGVAADRAGNVYVADSGNSDIRMIAPGGVVTTLAGNPNSEGTMDGIGTGAGFDGAEGIARDASGNLYVADFGSSTIRKIFLSGTGWMVTTIGATADMTGTSNGLGAAAQFDYPRGLTVDSSGNVYLVDTMNERISKGFPLFPPPVAVTGTAVATPYNATILTGTVNPNEVDTAYCFQYGTSTSYGSVTGTLDAGAGTVSVLVSATVTGLSPLSTYHFQLVAASETGTSDGGDQSFTTPPPPPAVTTGSATAITYDTATVTGTLNPNGLNTTWFFQYGTSVSYGSATAPLAAGSGTIAVPESAPIAGLTGTTTYHYQLVAANSTGTAYGLDQTFATAPPPPPPTAITGTAAAITYYGATLTGTVNPNGYNTTCWFQSGTGTSYGNTTPLAGVGSGTAALAVSGSIAGLTGTTTYHYQLVAASSSGTTTGSDQTFTTAVPPPKPTASTKGATPITFDSATLNATINPNGTDTVWFFSYGLNFYTGTTSAVDAGSGTVAVSVNATITGLTPSTTYHYQVTGSSLAGMSSGNDEHFTTAAAPPVPVVTTGSATGTASNSTTLNGTVNPNGADTIYYFQSGTTTAYGIVTGTQDAGNGTSAVPVSAALAGLNPSTAYHCQLVAASVSGTVYGNDQTFTTAQALALSATTVHIAQSGNDIQVSIQSMTGYSYQLQRAPSLGSPTVWQNIGNAQPGTGAVLTFVDSGGALLNSAFYRIQILQ